VDLSIIMNKWFHHALSSAALTLPAGFWFTEYMYSIVKVRGSSMEPALKDGDMILVRKTDFFPNYSISSESDDEKDLARSEKLELINSGYNAGIISSPPMVFQGHVVVFASPKTAFPKEYHVKRVTGIGGQMVGFSFSLTHL
jgi:signal peptidase I